MNPDELHASWGRRVKEAREGLGLSQRRLAQYCSVTQAAISRIERGVVAPRERLKWRIAGALSRSVEDLFPAFQLRPPFPEPVDNPEGVAS